MCDTCEILQGCRKVYLIFVHFTNIVLEFMTAACRFNLYIPITYGGLCKKGGKESSHWGNFINYISPLTMFLWECL